MHLHLYFKLLDVIYLIHHSYIPLVSASKTASATESASATSKATATSRAAAAALYFGHCCVVL